MLGIAVKYLTEVLIVNTDGFAQWSCNCCTGRDSGTILGIAADYLTEVVIVNTGGFVQWPCNY